MGGNLLRPYGAERLSNENFAQVKENISLQLDDENIVHAVAPYIGEKNSHGDLDIIIRSDFRERCRALFEDQKPFISNGDVDSFAFRLKSGALFQIDMIFMSPEHFDFSVKYFSYNDLGNLYGRFAHKMGIKFGHDGLKMPLRDGTDLFATLVLTTDFRAAVEFLGFSYERFEAGFDTFESLYKYVSDHPRFSPRMFDLAERNHTARVRDKKRPTYTGFTTWIDKNRGYLDDFNWPENKEVWKKEIFAAFPEAKVKHDRLWKEHYRKVAAKEKINGNHVMELTGLSGKSLGKLIQNFKNTHPDWVEYVLVTEQEDLDREFLRMTTELT